MKSIISEFVTYLDGSGVEPEDAYVILIEALVTEMAEMRGMSADEALSESLSFIAGRKFEKTDTPKTGDEENKEVVEPESENVDSGTEEEDEKDG